MCAPALDATWICVSRARARSDRAHLARRAGMSSCVEVAISCVSHECARQLYKTTDFAKQINLQTANMWGIVQHFVLAVRVRDNGSYILIKVR
jgi:hypothetical protein